MTQAKPVTLHGLKPVPPLHQRSWVAQASACFFSTVLILVLVFMASPIVAQVSSGSLLGDIRDENSASVSGVIIVARNNATGFSRTTSSNAFGSYRIDDLLPGSYTVTAQRDGFQMVTISPVLVEVNQKARADIELRVGSASDTLTIIAHTPPLQTDDASEGYLLGSSFLKTLPLL